MLFRYHNKTPAFDPYYTKTAKSPLCTSSGWVENALIVLRIATLLPTPTHDSAAATVMSGGRISHKHAFYQNCFVLFVKLTAAAQFCAVESEELTVASKCKNEANASGSVFFSVATGQNLIRIFLQMITSREGRSQSVLCCCVRMLPSTPLGEQARLSSSLPESRFME